MTRYRPIPDTFSVVSFSRLGSTSRSPSAQDWGKLELQACPEQLFLPLGVYALQLFNNGWIELSVNTLRKMQLLTTRVPRKFLDAALNHTDVLIIMKLAMSKYFQCERGRVANIAAL
jgi:hypothetical protein